LNEYEFASALDRRLVLHALVRIPMSRKEKVMDQDVGGAEKSTDPEVAAEAQVTAKEEVDLSEAVILLRAHPQWAIWRPSSGSDWTAIRPASSRLPAPELPTIWVHADTPAELARLMQASDEQISGYG
jgi:hypothetical protein